MSEIWTEAKLKAELLEMDMQAQRREAYRCCHNLMCNYQWKRSANQVEDVVKMFALDTEGVSVEIGGKIYKGADSVKRYFLDFIKALDANIVEASRLNVQELVNPSIEAAKDAKTAVGKWNTIGLETGVDENGTPQALWSMRVYCVDFIKEGGEWKFWHFREYDQYKTPYGGNGWEEIPWHDYTEHIKKYWGVDVDAPQYAPDETVEHRPYAGLGKGSDFTECFPPNPTPYDSYPAEWADLKK